MFALRVFVRFVGIQCDRITLLATNTVRWAKMCVISGEWERRCGVTSLLRDFAGRRRDYNLATPGPTDYCSVEVYVSAGQPVTGIT